MSGRPVLETDRLIHAAAELAASRVRHPDVPWDDAGVEAFVQLYRPWIIQALGLADAPGAWAERNAILLHLMTGSATIGEAIETLVRFGQTVWGARFDYIDKEEAGALVFHPKTPLDEEGLICALWSLKSVAIQLEFLAGRELESLSGTVSCEQSLPGNVTNLLFGKPLAFGVARTALVVLRSDLQRAVAVRAADIPEFLRNFMRAMIGAYRPPKDLRSLVSTLICDDRLRGSPNPTTMPDVARRLGLSVATARRRLHEEGVTFRAVKDDALDQLAKMWLRDRARSIESIAEQLGYSDSHAFRRAFRRRNGLSPRGHRSGDGADRTDAGRGF